MASDELSPFVEVRVWSLEEDVLSIDASVTSSTGVVVVVLAAVAPSDEGFSILMSCSFCVVLLMGRGSMVLVVTWWDLAVFSVA